jgi:hypothetical protein
MYSKESLQTVIKYLKDALTTSLTVEQRAWCEQQIQEHQKTLQEATAPATTAALVDHL